MRSIVRDYGKLLLAPMWPLNTHPDDNVSKDTKTYQSFRDRAPDNETGLDRLKEMFKLDNEFQTISPELSSIYQCGFLGFLVGAIYGGVVQSREGYMRFMENNEATAFKSHLDAKRKLQDQFTINFAKGGFKWGWRIGLFSTSYLGIVTCISVYRGKSSIIEYFAAGGITGALYKVNMGLRGMASGGIIGGALGGIAGVCSLLLMNLSGTTMEEMRYWQHKWRLDRDESVRQAIKVQVEQEGNEPELFKRHDEKVGTKVPLEGV